MHGAMQVRIADRLAALQDAGPQQPAALPAPAPPQQVGFLPTVEGGKWALQALPPGARAPPPGSVWAYLPTSTPGQTGGPCLHCCLTAALTKQLAVLVDHVSAAAHTMRRNVMQGCGSLSTCQRLHARGRNICCCHLSLVACLLTSKVVACWSDTCVVQQCAKPGKAIVPLGPMPCNAATTRSTVICVQ